MRTCIGLDIGRSGIKIKAMFGSGLSTELLIPSAVCHAFRLGSDVEADLASADTVTVKFKNYFIGKTALIQGSVDTVGGYRNDWVFTDEHCALFLGALKKIAASGVPDVEHALIVVGLPSALFATQRRKLAQILTSMAPHAEIVVMPQSLGPFQQLLFNPDGTENKVIAAAPANWAVIEVGQFTSDYSLVLEGRNIESGAGSCDGMRLAAENLQRIMQQRNISLKMVEASEVLRTNKIKSYGQLLDVTHEVGVAVEPLTAQIIDKATQLIGANARMLDGILVAGGGAPLIFPALRKVWPHSRESVNSRFAVADGFCRAAAAMTHYRSTLRNAPSAVDMPS